ncbi:MAG TPA: alpha/beta hydrolase [Puia sp.]|uniref:alpha/beta fold hydrolase n=1 Tax=Puia sp. TaxID=2045100 RepID=UPI002C8730F5|nr:alpha/beta hydrolase [Puia sp.]HVU94605.1 alpha/beta hydrolase [Puia sp.]
MPAIRTALLEISFLDVGPRQGPVIFLIHGWPDDIRAWFKVAPYLNAAGFRTIIPYLRGFGLTRFLATDTTRDGRGIALAQDVIDLADALGISDFFVAGHDWGARAAYLLAALFPSRVHKIAAMALAFQPRGEFPIPSFPQARLFWYQWFMCTEGGAAAVKRDPVGFSKLQWDTWSPAGWYDEEEFFKTAESFRNPDWAAVTLHGYRSRFLPEPIDHRYDDLQRRMSGIALLSTPTLVINGASDSCDPPSSFEEGDHNFVAGYELLTLDGMGHFPSREAPETVAKALIRHFRK